MSVGLYALGALGLAIFLYGGRWHVRGLRTESIRVAGKGLAVAIAGFLTLMTAVYHLYMTDL